MFASLPTSFFKLLAQLVVVLVLTVLVSDNFASASAKGHESGSNSGPDTGEPSGSFYKDVPLDDTYPDPKNATALNATTTGAQYTFTRTWPAASEATGSASQTQNNIKFPNPEYIRLLDASLLFYEAQRSGKLPADQRVKWRNDSALFDGNDMGLDLSGGYYDAGDYIKFTLPLTFTLTNICYGALEFFDGYVLANQTRYLDQMVRWGTDWLIKAHPNNNTLYVQVAIDEVDNNYWGPDTGIPNPRPSFFVSNTKPGTDVMADAAAAFASCSILYRDKLNDTAYAATLRTHAEVLYKVAETAMPQQVYQVVVPAAACCYSSTGFMDELAWGAAWMYRMTNDASYATKALQYTNQVKTKGFPFFPISWDDKISLVYILMAGLTQGTTEGAKWQRLAESYAELTVNPSKPCVFTKGGMYYCYGSSGDDSAVVASHAALAMALLASHMEKSSAPISAANKAKIDSYKAFTVKQVRYLLGENPEKTPYIVGVHPNSPVNPHSSLASGGRSTDTIDTVPIKEAHVLFGALVGGPDKEDRFYDLRSNWRQNEVALEYNAPFTSLMAYQVMTSQDPPPYFQFASKRPEDQTPGSIGGAVIWSAILIAVLISAVVLALTLLICHRQRNQIRFWVALQRQKFTSGKSPISLQNLPGSASTIDHIPAAATAERGEKYGQSDFSGSSSPKTPLSPGLNPMSSSDTLTTLVTSEQLPPADSTPSAHAPHNETSALKLE